MYGLCRCFICVLSFCVRCLSLFVRFWFLSFVDWLLSFFRSLFVGVCKVCVVVFCKVSVFFYGCTVLCTVVVAFRACFLSHCVWFPSSSVRLLSFVVWLLSLCVRFSSFLFLLKSCSRFSVGSCRC